MDWIAKLSLKQVAVEPKKKNHECVMGDATKPTKITRLDDHRQERISDNEPSPAPINKGLKSCPICQGRDFIHGINGGYFCLTCQPGINGETVTAGGNRTAAEGKHQQHVQKVTNEKARCGSQRAWFSPECLQGGN